MRASFLQNHCSIYYTLIVVRAVSSFATFGQSVYRSTVTWTKNFRALSLTMRSHPAPLANLTFFALDWPQGRVSRLCECLAVGIVADFCLVRASQERSMKLVRVKRRCICFNSPFAETSLDRTMNYS